MSTDANPSDYKQQVAEILMSIMPFYDEATDAHGNVTYQNSGIAGREEASEALAQLIEQEKTKARIEELSRHGTAAFAVGCGKDVEMRLEQLNKEEK